MVAGTAAEIAKALVVEMRIVGMVMLRDVVSCSGVSLVLVYGFT